MSTNTIRWMDHFAGRARIEVVGGAGLDRRQELDRWTLSLNGRTFVTLVNDAPDEGWEVEVHDLTTTAPPLPAEIDRRYREFASGSAAAEGGAALGALPPGHYWLVRSPRRPARCRYVVLGNQRYDAQEHQRLLLEGDPFHQATVIGPSGRAPRLDRPLLGLALSGYGGVSENGTLAFVPFGLDEGEEVQGAAQADLILVLPTTGPLVLSWLDDEPAWPAVAESLGERLAERRPHRLEVGEESFRMAGSKVDRGDVAPIQVERWGSRAEVCLDGRLVVSFETDDRGATRVRRGDGPRRIGCVEPAWEFIEPYLAWDTICSTTEGLGALELLPAGDYLLVKADRAALSRSACEDPTGRALPGADGVRLSLNVRSWSQPLLAAVHVKPGSVLLQVFDACTGGHEPSEAAGEVVIVLPLTGPLVIEERRDGGSSRDWRKRGARQTANALVAGQGGAP